MPRVPATASPYHNRRPLWLGPLLGVALTLPAHSLAAKGSSPAQTAKATGQARAMVRIMRPIRISDGLVKGQDSKANDRLVLHRSHRPCPASAGPASADCGMTVIDLQ